MRDKTRFTDILERIPREDREFVAKGMDPMAHYPLSKARGSYVDSSTTEHQLRRLEDTERELKPCQQKVVDLSATVIDLDKEKRDIVGKHLVLERKMQDHEVQHEKYVDRVRRNTVRSFSYIHRLRHALYEEWTKR